ncbi:MAG: hypothetical protein HC896_09165 [Bacteroidales bacterium]|nr:hypothetical protein [Bacteroidales bacterium]
MNPKPLGQKAYGSIAHLSNSRMGPGDHSCDPGMERIATKKTRDRHDLIIVQEKLDGTCCSVAKVENKILALGRSGYLAGTSPFIMHQYFAQWVKKHHNRFYKLLNEGERVVGEWLIQAHGTRYNLPHEPFVPFDLMHLHQRHNYHDFLLRVLPLGFTVPRLIHLGQPITVLAVMEQLEPSGHGAIDPIEGAVWRVERDKKVDFLVKYVRQDKQDGRYLPEISGKDPVWNVEKTFLETLQ